MYLFITIPLCYTPESQRLHCLVDNSDYNRFVPIEFNEMVQ